ncbi:ATP-binding protein [Streptomyces vilmorinianum]|uniref:ATP-binding protein n=1 Tax=Streptomyces vilmorinianum TaxID=3051092 RepID=UPI0032E7F8EB
MAAELTANAVRHGHVPGRDFRLRLLLAANTLRIEVIDTRTERQPTTDTTRTPPSSEESGRRLYVVARIADSIGYALRAGAPERPSGRNSICRHRHHPVLSGKGKKI